jgi:hypothetical protein
VGFEFNLPAADTSSGALDTTQFLDRNELTPTDHPTEIGETEEPFAALPDRPLTAEMGVRAPMTNAEPFTGTGPSGSTLPPQAGIEGAAREIARNAVEKVAWEVVPGLAKQSLERVINEIVERIVWDVVPAIAETAIKREIERLTRDHN